MRGLYAITPAVSDTRELCGLCAAALEGGAGILQYRNPDADAKKQQEQAKALAELARAFGVFFIVNNRPELAAEVGADGVHLGRDDPDLESARKIVGDDAVVGATCGNSPERVRLAREAGADYCAMGAVFSSPTKPEAERCELKVVAEVVRTTDAPIVAVGGIGLDNIAEVAATGVAPRLVFRGFSGRGMCGRRQGSCRGSFTGGRVKRIHWRGWIVPVGGSTPDRRVWSRLRANPAGAGGRGYFLSRLRRAKKFRDDSDFFSRRKDKRGWIVPVGGSTPDRRNLFFPQSRLALYLQNNNNPRWRETTPRWRET